MPSVSALTLTLSFLPSGRLSPSPRHRRVSRLSAARDSYTVALPDQHAPAPFCGGGGDLGDEWESGGLLMMDDIDSILEFLNPTADEAATALDVQLGMVANCGADDLGGVPCGPDGIDALDSGSGFGNSCNPTVDSAHDPGIEMVVPVPTWVRVEQRLDCSGCTLLREAVHDSDYLATKLQIHGALGIFHHATLVATYKLHGYTQHYFSNLLGHENGAVKKFLVEYGELRAREGLALVADSTCSFFDVLCVGLSGEIQEEVVREEGAITTTTISGAASSQPVVSSSDGSQEIEGRVTKFPKSLIAAQRERTGNLKLEDISPCFYLPITAASRELRLCTTALKKICRKYGISRWPHRKVKSTDAMLSRLKQSLRRQSGELARRTLMEMQKLQDERDRACEGWVGQIRRAQREILSLQEKLRNQSGLEAQRVAAEIAELTEKVKMCKQEMEMMDNGKKKKKKKKAISQ